MLELFCIFILTFTKVKAAVNDAEGNVKYEEMHLTIGEKQLVEKRLVNEISEKEFIQRILLLCHN